MMPIRVHTHTHAWKKHMEKNRMWKVTGESRGEERGDSEKSRSDKRTTMKNRKDEHSSILSRKPSHPPSLSSNLDMYSGVKGGWLGRRRRR